MTPRFPAINGPGAVVVGVVGEFMLIPHITADSAARQNVTIDRQFTQLNCVVK
jgi:hypothetical protein